jgi:predicted DNA-binding transcriptional regulator AlpA
MIHHTTKPQPRHTGDGNQSVTVQTAQPSKDLLGLEDLHARGVAPFSRTHLWRLIKAGKFPAPVAVGGGARKAWRASDIEAWLNELEPIRKAVRR